MHEPNNFRRWKIETSKRSGTLYYILQDIECQTHERMATGFNCFRDIYDMWDNSTFIGGDVNSIICTYFKNERFEKNLKKIVYDSS